MVCGGEARCQKGREISRRVIEAAGERSKEEGNGNGPRQKNL